MKSFTRLALPVLIGSISLFGSACLQAQSIFPEAGRSSSLVAESYGKPLPKASSSHSRELAPASPDLAMPSGGGNSSILGAPASSNVAVLSSGGDSAILDAPSSPSRELAPSSSNAAMLSGGGASAILVAPSQPAPPVARPFPSFGATVSNYIKEAFSVRNVIEGGLLAGMPALPIAPSQPMPPAMLDSTTGPAFETAMSNYGDGVNTWRQNTEVQLRYRARRAGVGIATAETRAFLSDLALPLALREDGRYVPADLRANFGQRMASAVASPFITRTPGGRLIPNFAHLGGTVAAGAIGERFYASAFNVPQLQTSNFLLKYTVYSLAGDVATNVARELVRSAIKPDLQRYNMQGEATEANYYSLTVAGKAAAWARSTYSPRHFVSAALLAGMPQINAQPESPLAPPINTTAQELAYDQALVTYGNDLRAWRQTSEENLRYRGRRALGGFAESETQGFLTGFAFPVLFRQDGRYIPTGSHNFGLRLSHPFTSLFVTREDSGHRTVNLSVLAGTPWAAYIADKVYYPELNTPQLATTQVLEKTIGFNFAGDVFLNLVHEFMPSRTF